MSEIVRQIEDACLDCREDHRKFLGHWLFNNETLPKVYICRCPCHGRFGYQVNGDPFAVHIPMEKRKP